MSKKLKLIKKIPKTRIMYKTFKVENKTKNNYSMEK